MGLLGCAARVAAQSAGQGGPGSTNMPVVDGSEPPVFPETLTRDDRGRATVRAIRLTERLVLDGRLDESVYSEYKPFGGFVQATPTAGAPSTERSDVWILYDDANIYLACRCWDSSPSDEWIINELRRDSNGLRQNEHFGVMFDTYYDRRSGFLFYANPLGARSDYSVVDEGASNMDWNPVWDTKGSQFDGGWIVEMAIPFKSLRYRSGPDQVWGLQLRRSIRHKNEWTYLNPVPTFMAGPQAFNRISSAGTLVGLDLPAAGANLELKPYVITRLTTDRSTNPPINNDRDQDVGVDLKYGVTANLTADLTVNTDFAQVEVDEQQVNLTRFNLQFPEKRDFFLEGRGLFDFAAGRFLGGGGTTDTPVLFYTRRVGLEKGRPIPIHAGVRLSGKVGSYALGSMNLTTADEPNAGVERTNFTVFRVKRDILRRSAIGLIFTNRSPTARGVGSNQAYGVDGAFAFFTNLALDAYYARTQTSDREGDPSSHRLSFSYAGDRYGLNLENLKVGDAFNPEVGFLRRPDFTKWSGTARFSPRPASIPAIRKLTWEGSVDYYENGAGELESLEQSARFNVEMATSDQFTLVGSHKRERLVAPFVVGTGVAVPPGEYPFNSVQVSYNFGPQRRVSGNASFETGQFYDGTIKSLSLSGARVVLSDHLSFEPGITANFIDLPAGEVRQRLFRGRTDYAFSSRMFAGAFLQYNAVDRAFSSNLRYRWEYRPGSEFFLVWTDERDTRPGGTGLKNRAFAIKATRLFR